MRYAVISDIHANVHALKAVLDAIRLEGVDRILCLGDLVGFHTSPGECIDMLRSHDVTCIAGNHDKGVTGELGRRLFPRECWEAIEWTREQLSKDQIDFLRTLPSHLVVDDLMMLMHGMMGSSHIYLVGRTKLTFAALWLKRAGIPLAFYGHTHQSSAYRISGKVFPRYVESHDTTRPLFFSEHVQHLINPGTVGQPRTTDTRAIFALLDTTSRRITWMHVAYDYGAVVEETLKIFPSHERLYRRFQEERITEPA